MIIPFENNISDYFGSINTMIKYEIVKFLDKIVKIKPHFEESIFYILKLTKNLSKYILNFISLFSIRITF